jgi:hypothetical protein
MGECKHCGKEAPEFHNYCNWDCHIEAVKAAGGVVYTPNGLPIRCIQAGGLLLEHEHGDHLDYKFPVKAVFYKTPEELVAEGVSWVDGNGDKTPMTVEDAAYDCYQTHALIYTDGTIALTLYECCYAMWELRTGKVLYGSSWEKGEWKLTDESLAKIKELVEQIAKERAEKLSETHPELIEHFRNSND